MAEEKSLDHVHNGLSQKGGLLGAIARMFTANATNFLELSRTIQNKLDQMDGPNGIHYLEALYEDKLVYRVHKDGGTTMYSSGYSVNDDGTVELAGEPTQVRQEYVPMTANEEDPEAGCGCGSAPKKITENETKHNEEEEDMSKNRKDMIAAFRANGSVAWKDEDQERLEALSCEEFAKELEAQLKGNTEERPDGDGKETDKPATNADDPAAAPATDPAAGTEEPVTLESYVDNAPEGVKETLRGALKAHNDRKAGLVEKIKAHSANKFTEDQLKSKDVAELENIAVFIDNAAPPAPETKHDPASRIFMGGAGGASVTANDEATDEDALEVPSINAFMPEQK